jgi:hypothetical protein
MVVAAHRSGGRAQYVQMPLPALMLSLNPPLRS